MVNEKLECLLKYINGSLERCSEEELAYLIKNKNIISNIDFHGFQILSYILLLRRAHLEALFLKIVRFLIVHFSLVLL